MPARTVLPPHLAPLAPSFSREELHCSHCGALEIQSQSLQRLQHMRDILNEPLRVNSGYRCPAHNKAVGGAPKSQHVEGKAFDIRCHPEQRFRYIKAAMEAGFTYIIIYSAWLHVDDRPITTPVLAIDRGAV